MLKRRLLTLLFAFFCCLPALVAQIVLLTPQKDFLWKIAEANERDSTHLDALSHLLFTLANNRMMSSISSEGSSTEMDSLLREAFFIGDELGGAFVVRARIAQIRMDARVCPQYTKERREETLENYLALHDSLARHPGPQSSRLQMEAFSAIYWQCSSSWYNSENQFDHAEKLYADEFLAPSDRILMANYLIAQHLSSSGDTERALSLIQETLRKLETLDGEHGVKFSTYQMLSSFFGQATADYDKANEMLFLAAKNARELDTERLGDMAYGVGYRIQQNYEKQNAYERAESILDSLKDLSQRDDSAETDGSYLLYKLRYCRLREKTECAEYLEALTALLNSPSAADLYPHTRFYALSEVALYHHYQENEAAAFPWYLRANELLKELRFFEVGIATDLREAYGAELEARGDLKEALSIMNSVSRLKQYQLNNKERSAQKRALYDLNVREYRLGQLRAEQLAENREKEIISNRRFYWSLLGGTVLLLLLGSYSYWRSRRDARRLTAQKEIVDQSLSEKEVLLREIHHRVKNNLQIISSLLQKQARVIGNSDARRLAKEGQERIQSMALIHENLYQSEQLSGVNIRAYLHDLGINIARSHATPGAAIDLHLEVEDFHLDLDTAIPVGLILNELLTNAYKYAFPQKESGTIRVTFQKTGEQFELEVSDDGVGLPTDHADRGKKSLGHNLVSGLVRQLEGTIEWLKPSKGTRVKISF